MNDLEHKIRKHLQWLSPHIKERQAPQLLIEAADAIKALHEALEAERTGVHSCHDKCERTACVLHRRIAELECHVGMARRLLQGAISPHSNDCYRAEEWVERKVAWLRAVDIAAEKGSAA